MTGFDYDLFVIGGGSGGVRAGRLAGAIGKKVGLAEEYRMGAHALSVVAFPKNCLSTHRNFPNISRIPPVMAGAWARRLSTGKS